MGRLVSREDVVVFPDARPITGALDLVVLKPMQPIPGAVDTVVAGLRAQGVDARLTADPGAGSRPLAVVDGSVLVSEAPLGALYDDPRLGTAALALSSDQAGRESLGLLRVAPEDRPVAAPLLARATGPDPVLQVVHGLEAAGIRVSAVPLGGFVWARVTDGLALEEARAAVRGVDERRVRLREAARGGDGFYSTFVLRKLSWRLTGVAERLGVTPNQVTIASFLIGLLAAGVIATGDRPLMVLGAVLLQLCLVVDCVDGELARYRRRFSRFGAWLDAVTDRVKEFAAITAFAVAADSYWGLAAGAIALQTFRNLADLGWAAQRGAAVQSSTAGVSTSPWVSAGARLVTPTHAPGPGALEWVRRVGHFPVGERFLVMSIGALVLPPRVTLVVLLVLGALAGLYLLAAFAVRSRPGRPVAVGQLVDGGFLLARLRVGGRLGALLPAVVAAVELGVSWLLVGGRVGLVVVAVTAIAHYQAAYGAREGQVVASLLGTDVRLVVLAVAALTGFAWIALGLAAAVAATSTTRSLRAWAA